MEIKFFPKYSYSGASSRYRTYQYAEYFKENGIECKIYPLFDDRHIQNIRIKKRFSIINDIQYTFNRFFRVLFLKKRDIIFIEKEFIPYFPPLLEWYIYTRGIKYILDYDDAIVHNYDMSSNKIIRKCLSGKIPYIQKKAFAVINGSTYLYEKSKLNNLNSFLIPTSIDIHKYAISERQSKKFVIGWIGSVSTSKLIIPFIDIFEDFCKNNEAEVHLIGFDQQLILDKDKNIFKVIEWKEEEEVGEIAKFNIGISPSDDTPFTRGKCAFKSIQYMACGKPVITSPVGANADVVIHGETGFHANTNEEWKDYLNYLYDHPEESQKMGLSGRERVISNYTVQSNLNAYLEIFKTLIQQ